MECRMVGILFIKIYVRSSRKKKPFELLQKKLEVPVSSTEKVNWYFCYKVPSIGTEIFLKYRCPPLATIIRFV